MTPKLRLNDEATMGAKINEQEVPDLLASPPHHQHQTPSWSASEKKQKFGTAKRLMLREETEEEPYRLVEYTKFVFRFINTTKTEEEVVFDDDQNDYTESIFQFIDTTLTEEEVVFHDDDDTIVNDEDDEHVPRTGTSSSTHMEMQSICQWGHLSNELGCHHLSVQPWSIMTVSFLILAILVSYYFPSSWSSQLPFGR